MTIDELEALEHAADLKRDAFRRCGLCPAFQPWMTPKDGTGFCRADTPRGSRSEKLAYFPLVDTNDWCIPGQALRFPGE